MWHYLVHYFVERYAAKIGRRITTVRRTRLARLTAYTWPGNVRELENVIERAVILSPGPELAPEALSVRALRPRLDPRADHTGGLARRTSSGTTSWRLERTNWRIDGPRGPPRPEPESEHAPHRMQSSASGEPWRSSVSSSLGGAACERRAPRQACRARSAPPPGPDRGQLDLLADRVKK